jgi:hypothetical protein
MRVISKAAQQAVAVALTICLLILSALVYPQVVAHAAHHAHHQAATHATVLCSWICAAGQVLEAISLGLHTHLTPVALTSIAVSHEAPSAALPFSPTRGPPGFFI